MFSFHKPKIYRSNLGCCICKAKSSSSRFTDSQKYENEFERCFRIKEKRSGEICNACVLLVKRWKKLSPDSRLIKHWHHVVDARAGPGTKLTSNRRIINHQSSGGPSSRCQKASSGNNNGGKSDVLPLSSSQAANNQASGGALSRGRASSFSKARAIDTNVSTFTFGEPPSAFRRNHMTSEHVSYSTYSALSPQSSMPGGSFGVSGGLTKPQSALNSSAFESVIKRFRQRQQQQHLEAQRRQQNRQQRLLARQQQQQHQQQLKTGKQQHQTLDKSPHENKSNTNADETSTSVVSGQKDALAMPSTTSSKRVKRLSENYGSLVSYESLKVASVLDSSIWSKEKICCGIIFRGLFNEVAIFPKLLKPCECRLRKLRGVVVDDADADEEETKQAEDTPLTPNENQEGASTTTLLKKDLDEPESPPPRATKSGSISSNTSGTGSMEQPIHDEALAKSKQQVDITTTARNSQPVAKRPRSVPTKRRRHNLKNDDGESSSTGGGTNSEASSKGSAESADSPSSGSSSSRIMLLIDGEEVVRGEDDDEDDDMDDHEHELVSAEDDGMESSNDASSTAESLVAIEGKNALAMG